MSPKVLVLACLCALISSQQFLGLPPLGSGSSCCDHNKIVVSGNGVASGQPDIAKVTVGFEVSSTTSEGAVNELSVKINRVISTLLALGFPRNSYETQSLNVRGDYNYANGRSQLVGYIASQYLTVTVRQIDAKATKVSGLVDQLATINGI